MKTPLEKRLFKIYEPYLHGKKNIPDKVLNDFKKYIERVSNPRGRKTGSFIKTNKIK